MIRRSPTRSPASRRALLLVLLPVLFATVTPLAVHADIRTGRLAKPEKSPGWGGKAEALRDAAERGARTIEPETAREQRKMRRYAGDAAVPASWPDEPTAPETVLGSSDDRSFLEVEEPRDLTDLDLDGSKFRSTLEPMVAGDESLLVTGNHFAAFSNDGGETFREIDPNAFLRWQDDEEFCCDQVAAFDSYRELLVWLAQSQRKDDDTRSKSLRLAVSQGADRRVGRFVEYVLTPELFGWSADVWFDFSDLVVGGDFLCLSALANLGGGAGGSEGVTIRLPLDALAGYEALKAVAFAEPNTYLRAVRGAGRNMVLAATGTYEALWVWRWPEDEAEPSEPPIEVSVEPWTEPDQHGEAWLQRADGTLMAAWAEGHHLGFAWTAGHTAAYPRPHVRVAILDRKTLGVVAQPHLWNRTTDFAFPAVAVNRSGSAGISLLYDGDDGFPGHAVGVLHEPCDLDGPWEWEVVSVRESAAVTEPWGDYLAIVPDARNSAGWLATGYALDAEGKVHPHLVRFGLHDGRD